MRTISLVCSLTAMTTLVAAGPDWTQYGGPNRNFTCPKPTSSTPGEDRLWKRPLGQGTSGIVSDGESLFTMYSVPDEKNKNQGQEIVVRLNRVTGKTVWEDRVAVARLKGQQSFTGEAIRPQSTPALSGKRLCTLGYTGLLKCFDTENGKILWQHDLVKDFSAVPVQFGFSSSPLVFDQSFIVHVGGNHGVIAFEIESGKPRWKSGPAQPSYASPVLMATTSGPVIVQFTRDAILGLSPSDGAQKWKYPLPEAGLTNVPTPIVLNDQRLLISGQGVKGTRLLEVTSSATGESIREIWKNERVTYFYTNWYADTEAVYGAIGETLVATRLADGKELFRHRGHKEENLLRIGDETILLRGDGFATRATLNKEGTKVIGALQAIEGRSWTPPTLLGDLLYLRSETEITAIKVSAISTK